MTFLSESQWRLSMIAAAGAAFQVACLFIILASSGKPSPKLYLVAAYLPLTFVAYMFYFKLFG